MRSGAAGSVVASTAEATTTSNQVELYLAARREITQGKDGAAAQGGPDDVDRKRGDFLGRPSRYRGKTRLFKRHRQIMC